MTAQGWQPGDILGLKNASYAEFHTAANASHIRVIVKDGNLGLGAKRGGGLAEGECTGLDVFQSLLGRLNGKGEDELTKEQKSREDLKRAIYTETRWGSVRFVKGGYLVGDKIQELVDLEENRIRKLAQRSSATVPEASECDSSARLNLTVSETQSAKKNKGKKKQKEVRKQNESGEVLFETQGAVADEGKSDQTATQDMSNEVISTKPKNSKKKKKHKAVAGPSQAVESVATTNSTPTTLSLFSTPVPDQQLSTPQSVLGGRHAVRSRNIAQKRLAVLDTASLNQVSARDLFLQWGKETDSLKDIYDQAISLVDTQILIERLY